MCVLNRTSASRRQRRVPIGFGEKSFDKSLSEKYMHADHSHRLSVLLEHETGVMEVFCGPTPDNATDQVYPISSVPCSGTIKATDRQQLAEAVTLSRWAQDHIAVFEGKVSP